MAKEIKSRIQQKHDIEANWKLAINFIPKQAEIIIYDIDDNYDYERFKIGDGVTKINDLPFSLGDLHPSDFDMSSVESINSSVEFKGYFVQAINFVNKYIILTNERPSDDLIIVETGLVNSSEYYRTDVLFADEFANKTIFNLNLYGIAFFNVELVRESENGNAWNFTTFPVTEEELEEYRLEIPTKLAEGRVVEQANYIWNIEADKEDLANWGIMQGISLPKSESFAFGHGSKALQSNSFAAGERNIAQGKNSVALGRNTVANKGAFSAGYGNIAEGVYSFTIGGQNIAKGTASAATGNKTLADGDFSFAEGRSTGAYGHSAHAEGWMTVTGEGEVPDPNPRANSDTTPGYFAHAEGNFTRAKGNSSHAEGRTSQAEGIASHAEGWNTVASGARSHSEGSGTQSQGFATHAEGHQTIASGQGAHAEGGRYVDSNNTEYYTTASGSSSHAEGQATIASGEGAHAEGIVLIKDNSVIRTEASKKGAHAEGLGTIASGEGAHAEGAGTTASGSYAHAEGRDNTASSYGAHAEGSNNVASGTRSHAEGRGTQATGDYSHAEGNSTLASGERSHAEGSSSIASGIRSHAEGNQTKASGMSSHAEGSSTVAGPAEEAPQPLTSATEGYFSHAEGNGTWARGNSSHAEGIGTIASGKASHASGIGTIAEGQAQTVIGKYSAPISDQLGDEFTEDQILFKIGNGTAENDRANAFFVTDNGTVGISSGTVLVNCNEEEPDTLATSKEVQSTIDQTLNQNDLILGGSNAYITVASGGNNNDIIITANTVSSKVGSTTFYDDGKIILDGQVYLNDTALTKLLTPSVTSLDNGKILTVENGQWQAKELENTLIVTVSGTTPSHTSKEIYEATIAGKDVYLHLWGTTYISLARCTEGEVRFSYNYTTTAIDVNGTSRPMSVTANYTIKDNVYSAGSITVPSQQYVDAMKTLIVTVDGTTPSSTNAEIYSAVTSGRAVYLQAADGTYVLCSKCTETLARFEQVNTYDFTIDGTRHSGRQLYTYIIQNDVYKTSQAIVPSKSYVDAVAGGGMECVGSVTVQPYGNEGNEEWYIGDAYASNSATGSYSTGSQVHGIISSSDLLMIEYRKTEGERIKHFGSVGYGYTIPKLPQLACEYGSDGFYIAQEVADTIFETGTYNSLCDSVTFTGYKLPVA